MTLSGYCAIERDLGQNKQSTVRALWVMAKQYPTLTPQHRQFIAAQHIFFVGTAAPDGRVNVSPKGMDSLRVLSHDRVLWLNLTGSGNETAAHLQTLPRMTLMFCALSGQPLILRIYGQAQVIHPRDRAWADAIAQFPDLPGARQVIDLQIELVQTSCGMGVPRFDYQGEREDLANWARSQGQKGLEQYWAKKNQVSLDGLPTHILQSDQSSI